MHWPLHHCSNAMNFDWPRKISDINNKIIKHRLIFGFLGIIGLFVFFGVVSIKEVHTSGSLTKMIYEHPLVVSNAALNAGIGIIRMHRSMKDVILSNSPAELESRKKTVDEQEKFVYRHLDIIRDQIIGAEGEKLETRTRVLVREWQPIREAVFRLYDSGRINDAASITTGKGAEHVAKLESMLAQLTAYARNKAANFMQLAEQSHKRAISLSVFLVLVGVLLSSIIAFFTAKHVLKNEGVLERQIAERTADLKKANQKLQHEIKERKQAYEKQLRAERKYRTVADYTHDWEYWVNADGSLEYVSPSCERISGYTVKDFMVNPKLLRGIIVPEDYGIWDQHVSDSTKDFSLKEVQFRIKNKNGEIRWIEQTWQPVKDRFGELKGFRASNRDVTVRKKSEQALQASRNKAEILATKLLSSQEDERSRIARELHDDITQRLAFLNIELDKLTMKNDAFPGTVKERLRQIGQDIGKLSADIHMISRRLHPTSLSVLGLVRCIESECNNFSRLKEIPLTSDLDVTICNLSKETSLSTYRILQEGLGNIYRHAKASRVHVALTRQNDRLRLVIKDNGIGFDPESNDTKLGLGIASMTERARLIQGDLAIASRPGEGTEIKLTVPLKSGIEA